MYKIIFGIIIGVFLSVSFTFLYRTYYLRDYVVSAPDLKTIKPDPISGKNIEQAIINSTFDEKINSLNKRSDDFLLFGSMIITLMLGISVSVYLRTEGEVTKHFKENFSSYQEKVIEATSHIEKLLSEAQSNAEIVNALKQKAESQTDKTID
ncbi:MAG: hypothetical protein ABI367_07955 [Mucilaginibacter sp.]